MKSARSVGWALAMVLAVVAVMAVGSGDDLIAQVRAAWTKNVDEPGLVPFTFTFQVSQTECNCTNCCFVNTSPVAAGKRLVIKNVSGHVSLTAVGNLGPVTLSQMGPGPGFSTATIATLPVTFRNQWNGGDYPAYEFNEEILAYVDAGSSARFAIYTGSTWDSRGGQVTINGYLVSLQ